MLKIVLTDADAGAGTDLLKSIVTGYKYVPEWETRKAGCAPEETPSSDAA